MARFYKTSSPTFVQDKMFQLPFQEMGAILQNKDQQFQKSLDEVYSLAGVLEAKALPQQQEKLNEIFQGYEGNIEDLAKTLQEDPINYQKKLGDIRRLKKDIHTNFSRGNVSTIQSNYDALQGYKTSEKERVKSGEIRQSDLSTLINKRFNEFQGLDDEGNLNSFNIEQLNKYADVQKIGEELGEGYKADQELYMTAGPNGDYIWKSKRTEEVVDPAIVEKDVYEGLMNNEDFNSYYDQQFGITGENRKEIVAKQEAQRVASKFGYKKVDGSKSVSVDSSKSSGYRGPKKEELKDQDLFFQANGFVNSSVSSTSQGLFDKDTMYTNNIEFTKTSVNNIVDSLPNLQNLPYEEKQKVVNAVLNGTISEAAANELGFRNFSELREFYNTNLENTILKNQNNAVIKTFEAAKETDPTLTYERFARNNDIKDQNPTNVEYSFKGFELDDSEIKNTQKYVKSNLPSGVLDFSNNLDIVRAVQAAGGQGTSFTLNELVGYGILNPKTVVKKGEKEVSESYEDSTSSWWNPGSWGDTETITDTEIVKYTFESDVPGLENFELVPETLGVGNAKNQNGQIDFAMKANGGQGKQYIVRYPASKMGNKKINAKLAENYKVIRLKDILSKGSKSSSYTIAPDNIRVVKSNGTQFLQEFNLETNTWNHLGELGSISGAEYKRIADKIFK